MKKLFLMAIIALTFSACNNDTQPVSNTEMQKDDPNHTPPTYRTFVNGIPVVPSTWTQCGAGTNADGSWYQVHFDGVHYLKSTFSRTAFQYYGLNSTGSTFDSQGILFWQTQWVTGCNG